ncbi:hypothetical protein B0H16DRAFT_1689535 [Mycena metata]|uniref:F-box domain-containing protein n=1 Tax=Mycena metata TaxID=1033252 RepID=A0AAD7J7R7_9AGAR|nr:hypothetical protein B0H16DRAFT_1689535 [Mycena metata]
MRNFPQELVDLILDRVADVCSDNTDLAACGRVCRQWMPRSRMHFFSRIRIQLSRADPTTIQSFLDIVDTSPVDVLFFVQTLNLAFIRTEGPEREYDDPADRLCPPLLDTHIRRFGACPSLTRFELNLPGDIRLHVLSDIVTALPLLTHLRICGRGGDYTILKSETSPVKDIFPSRLRDLDISVDAGGAGVFFGWLLSYGTPPTFTSLVLIGDAMGRSIAPIEFYLELYGSTIETLSLAYWVSDSRKTETFEMRALSTTPQLTNLSLEGQYAQNLPTTLATIASVHLINLDIHVRPRMNGCADWPRIDEVLGVRSRSLKRICFELYETCLADIASDVSSWGDSGGQTAFDTISSSRHFNGASATRFKDASRIIKTWEKRRMAKHFSNVEAPLETLHALQSRFKKKHFSSDPHQ